MSEPEIITTTRTEYGYRVQGQKPVSRTSATREDAEKAFAFYAECEAKKEPAERRVLELLEIEITRTEKTSVIKTAQGNK